MIYRQSYARPALAFASSICLIWWFPFLRSWQIELLCAYLIGAAFIEMRRAIILTDSNLLYRPIFGRPTTVEFSRIASVERCSAPVPSLMMLRPMLMKGLKFHLIDGGEIVIPLDFRNSKEISERFLTNS
jgi:hypothetical protein